MEPIADPINRLETALNKVLDEAGLFAPNGSCLKGIFLSTKNYHNMRALHYWHKDNTSIPLFNEPSLGDDSVTLVYGVKHNKKYKLNMPPASIDTRKVVYLAGPITGVPNHNYPLFNRLARFMAEDMDYRVINPANHTPHPDQIVIGEEANHKRGWMLQAAREILTDAHELRLLPGWRHSSGARAEVALAVSIGLPVWEIVDIITHPTTDEIEDILIRVLQPNEQIVMPAEKNETIAHEALELVQSDRRKDYGDAYDDFTRTAGLMNQFFPKGVLKFDAATMIWSMIAVKLSRACYKYKRDNLVDLIGYTLLLDQVIERQKDAKAENPAPVSADDMANSASPPSRPNGPFATLPSPPTPRLDGLKDWLFGKR